MLKKIMPAVMAMFLCAAVSYAEESITIQMLHKSFPNVKAEKAGKSVIPGLYEVEAGNNVFYFEPRNGYLIFGDIITKEGKNLTAEKRQELLARRGRLILLKLTLVHDSDSSRESESFLLIMRNVDDRCSALLVHALKRCPHLHSQTRIQIGQRFVH